MRGVQDARAAAELVGRHLPGVRGGSLEPLGEGDFCLAFALGRRVVRVARHAEAASALRREACVLAAVADRLPVPVPGLELHEPEGGLPFTVHRRLDGAVLTRERWEALPASPRRAAAAALAGFLKALHDVPTDAVARCGLERLDARRMAAELLDRAPDALGPRLEPGATPALARALERERDAPGPRPPDVLLHGDLAPGHVFFDPDDGRLTGVIDFGDAALGEAARDFVFVYEDFGPRMLAAVLEAYAGSGAGERARRIRTWYLLEAVAWTLERVAEGRGPEIRHGVAEIARVLGEVREGTASS